MLRDDGELIETMLALEESHLRHDIRSSPKSMGGLLADEFVEFGSSGRVITRDAVIEAVSRLRQAPFQSRIAEFRCVLLSPAVALTTYRLFMLSESSSQPRVTLRSSVWVERSGQWFLLFHQGTPVRAPDDAS